VDLCMLSQPEQMRESPIIALIAKSLPIRTASYTSTIKSIKILKSMSKSSLRKRHSKSFHLTYLHKYEFFVAKMKLLRSLQLRIGKIRVWTDSIHNAVGCGPL
jgi:hypothetical protein